MATVRSRAHVPQPATGVFFGVLLSGSGEVWLNDAKIETVGADVPPTSVGIHPLANEPKNLADEPTNLDFRE